MRNSPSPSPSPSPSSSDYGSPCLCCGNKKRRALTSPSSSPSSSPSPPFNTGNKRSKHTFQSSPTSVTSSFSFPTRSDYAAAPSLSLPPAIRDKILFASPFNSFSNASASSSASTRPTTVSSSSPFSIGTLSSQSPPSPVNLFPAFGDRNSFGQWAWPAKNVEIKAVTSPSVAKKSEEEEAVTSPREKKSDTDAVIEQPDRKIEKAVLLPIKEEDEEATAERISSLNLEKEAEAVASPQKKKTAEAVVLPRAENEHVEVTIDCSSKSSSPRRSIKVENAREEIRVGLKCKCGIVREIILV